MNTQSKLLAALDAAKNARRQFLGRVPSKSGESILIWQLVDPDGDIVGQSIEIRTREA